MALKEWNLSENFNLEELNDNFSYLDEKIETTNTVVNTKASQTSVTDLAQDVTDLTTVVSNHATYSTTEEVVIGTYNGKPHYRKALLLPSIPNTAATSYPHAIANIEKITVGAGSYFTDGTLFLPCPYPNNVSTAAIAVYCSATMVSIGTGRGWPGFSATIFLEYTKTTD